MHPLWSNIFRKKARKESLPYFLGTVPAFAELKPRDLVFLESMVHLRRYAPREIVFAEGDVGSGMYIVRTGRVRIFTYDAAGEEVELAQLGPGDFFGETTLTAPANRLASAITLEAAELVGLFRADLLEAVQKHPAIAAKILLGINRILCERIQTAALELQRRQGAGGAETAADSSPS